MKERYFRIVSWLLKQSCWLFNLCKKGKRWCVHEQMSEMETEVAVIKRGYCTLGTSIATSLIALGFTTDMAHWRSCRVTVTVPVSCWSGGWWEPPSARLSACKPVERGCTHFNSLLLDQQKKKLTDLFLTKSCFTKTKYISINPKLRNWARLRKNKIMPWLKEMEKSPQVHISQQKGWIIYKIKACDLRHKKGYETAVCFPKEAMRVSLWL